VRSVGARPGVAVGLGLGPGEVAPAWSGGKREPDGCPDVNGKPPDSTAGNPNESDGICQSGVIVAGLGSSGNAMDGRLGSVRVVSTAGIEIEGIIETGHTRPGSGTIAPPLADGPPVEGDGLATSAGAWGAGGSSEAK
jgi:hypothetical protein